jgi:hypothetical protein
MFKVFTFATILEIFFKCADNEFPPKIKWGLH